MMYKVPTSGVVLLGSPSHLGARGIDCYASELVGCLSLISALAGRGVEAVPLVPVPLRGIGPATILRDLFDLDAWLLRTGKGAGMQFSKTKEIFWGLVRSGGGVMDVAPLWGDRVLSLPAHRWNSRRQFMWSLAPVPPLPCKFHAKEERWLNGSAPDCKSVVLGSNPAPPQHTVNSVSPEVGSHLGSHSTVCWPLRWGRGTLYTLKNA